MKPKYAKALQKLDAKDRSFVKNYGEFHPISEIDDEINKRVHIVKDNEDEEEEFNLRKATKKFKAEKHMNTIAAKKETELNEILRDAIDDVVMPYQQLLNELAGGGEAQSSKRSKQKAVKKLISKKSNENESPSKGTENENEEEDHSETENDQENMSDALNTHAQEVLCKDDLDSEESLVNDPFHIHFEQNIESNLMEKLKTNSADRAKLNEYQERYQWPHMGSFIYTSPLSEKKLTLNPHKNLKQNFVKQRIVDRLNEAVDITFNKYLIDNEEKTVNSEFNLGGKQLEMLSIISNYVDFYDPNVDVKSDTKNKFTYAIHALNHSLKTRSRIIAHNDKIKQNKSNVEIEYRDQGLTRPKVLIIVPFRKHVVKLVKVFIALLMRKNEESVSNKKRFFDSFGPDDCDKDDDEDEDDNDNDDEEISGTSSKQKTDKSENRKAEDFNFLLSGNTDDHFRIGLSVSKKSLKLFTQFYSSDIIIASPLGLKSVIGNEGDSERDFDFLSSIELLIVDNADVLMMQNWEHVMCVFQSLHMQPKQSHDVDFSRVRFWLLEGQARYYRQTLVFSRIPAPPINNIFNRFCQNFAGKCQIDLLPTGKYQIGTICQIGFQLGQIFNRIECDNPADLPTTRFHFFIDKLLPKFRDEMMSHTLIFIPSYFDFVKIRNYFKKNDISSMNVTEYTDKKSVDRARYLFFHGKVHFMLLTERMFFYKRYKIRGINHLIFYDLPHFADYYANFCNFLPDAKRAKNATVENFTSTVLYSKFDAQKLCSIVGQQRATHMINSEKNVHMFMTE